MEGNSTSSVPTCSLQKDASSPERVSGSTRWFQNCFPGIHSLQSHLERKYGIEKDPLPTEPEQQNNGRWRKNNTRASLSMGGGSSTEDYYGISFNMISSPCHWRRYRDHERLSNLSSSMEQGLEWTHLGRHAMKERRLWHTCAGLSHLWDIHLKPRHVLGERMLPLTVARLNSSCTSLSPSFDLLFSSSLTLPLAPLQCLLNPPATG